MALPTVPDEYVLFDEKSSEQVAERYLRAGCREVVVKAGPNDALLTDGETSEWVGPGQSIQPIDTTGAGDSFNGSYIAARLAGQSMGCCRAVCASRCRAGHSKSRRACRQHQGMHWHSLNLVYILFFFSC